jgi:hypothetical protein
MTSRTVKISSGVAEEAGVGNFGACNRGLGSSVSLGVVQPRERAHWGAMYDHVVAEQASGMRAIS